MNRHQSFWDKEYKKPQHLTLSDEPAEDLMKFTRWVERNVVEQYLNKTTSVLDLGCGNGRNLIWLAREFKQRGAGYDISEVALKQAKAVAEKEKLPLTFVPRSISGHIDLPDNSTTLVLDMMTSHYLKHKEREMLRDEIIRVLEPGGFLFYKTFLLEEDQHAKRMIKDFPGDEPNSYIHPRIGVFEHVMTEDDIREFFQPMLRLKKIYKSHKHLSHGQAFRRRTVTAYLEKPWE